MKVKSIYKSDKSQNQGYQNVKNQLYESKRGTTFSKKSKLLNGEHLMRKIAISPFKTRIDAICKG